MVAAEKIIGQQGCVDIAPFRRDVWVWFPSEEVCNVATTLTGAYQKKLYVFKI